MKKKLKIYTASRYKNSAGLRLEILHVGWLTARILAAARLSHGSSRFGSGLWFDQISKTNFVIISSTHASHLISFSTQTFWSKENYEYYSSSFQLLILLPFVTSQTFAFPIS